MFGFNPCAVKEALPPSEKDWYLKKENKDILREVRYLDIKTSFEPFISIYDHLVTIISSRRESFALVIEARRICRKR